METIAERLKTTQAVIARATKDAHRASNSVKLLAVSKTKPVSDIVQAYEAGHRSFGENYAQEGVEKIQSMQQFSDIEWHFIGPLQSNKSRVVAEHFDWVQSVDREKLAIRLNNQRSPHKKLNVLIQVNIDEEHSKSGVLPNDIELLAHCIAAQNNLTLRGLMAIPKAHQDPVCLNKSFARMNTEYEKLKAIFPSVDTLSMGMSGDILSAIESGSTMVRVGTGIFGKRDIR